MTLAQLEERVAVLEQQFQELQVQLARGNGAGPTGDDQNAAVREDDLIPGTECDVVLTVPPIAETVVRARIVSVERDESGLALSEEEWASLQLEDDDD